MFNIVEKGDRNFDSNRGSVTIFKMSFLLKLTIEIIIFKLNILDNR